MQSLSLVFQKFTGLLDRVNDNLTSYRLVLYSLLAMLAWSVVGSFFNKVPYSSGELLISAAWLVAVCWLVNKLLARFLNIPANKESDLISGLILALILTPPASLHGFAVLAAAGATAMLSKYLITMNKSHVFNPAAAGIVVAGLAFHDYASWWVGTDFMIPLVAIAGVLILRKMKRFGMIAVFLVVYILCLAFGNGFGAHWNSIWTELVSTQTLFFAAIMLTEPQTSPTTAKKYLPYAVLVAVLYTLDSLHVSPGEALLAGNLLTLLIAPNHRYILRFTKRIREADGIYTYVFARPPKFNFAPGQYMEWALAHDPTDSRGNRRYLTISSSPTEDSLAFTIKHPSAKASSFKRKLDELKPDEMVLASHLAGEFTLPKDPAAKLTFLAGGVGITPFRSMIKYLVDNKERRDIILLYSASSPQEIAYANLFELARPIGLRSAYITKGLIDNAKLTSLPSYRQRTYYVSGPYSFVQAMEQALLKLQVAPHRIVTDYFPGYGG